MELMIDAHGVIRCLYDETLLLNSLGSPVIQRASHVEPTSTGLWVADLEPVQGPQLGPFVRRSAALAAETAWLQQNWLLSDTMK